MLKEFEFFHGIVFARMLHSQGRALSVDRYSKEDNAAYSIDNQVGIYIKYSSKRLGPWRFSFQKRHQDLMLEMRNRYGKMFLLLVCNDDGIVVLSFDELKRVLDTKHEEIEWVSVHRSKREMYGVAGSDGKLNFKIGKNEFSKMFGVPKYISSAVEEDPQLMAKQAANNQ